MEQVLLIECHELLRSALQGLLARSGFNSIGEAADPIAAVRQTIQQAPQIIVLDTTVREMEGFYLGRMLRALAPQSKIVLLLDNVDADYQAAARSSGADAMICKSALALELPELLSHWQQQATS